MAQTGYQDWGRYPIPSSDNIVSELVPAASIHNGPITDCSSWSFVQVVMFNTDPARYVGGNILWYGYASTVQNTTFDFFTLGPGDYMSYVAPVRGRSLQIGYATLNGAPTSGVDYAVVGMTHEATKYDVRNTSDFLINDVSAYGANSNKTIRSQNWYEGPVSVCTFSSAAQAASVAFLKYDQVTLSYQTFAVVGITGINNTLPQTIQFPAAPVEAFIQNPGAAQTIELHVQPIPIR